MGHDSSDHGADDDDLKRGGVRRTSRESKEDSELAVELEHSDDVLQLRVATFNLSQGVRGKLPAVLGWAYTNGVQVMALQETGDQPTDRTHLPYRVVRATHRTAGVALCVRADVDVCTVKEWQDVGSGRAVAVLLQTAARDVSLHCCFTLVVCCYLPTGLDRSSMESERGVEACRIYDLILGWCSDAEAYRDKTRRTSSECAGSRGASRARRQIE